MITTSDREIFGIKKIFVDNLSGRKLNILYVCACACVHIRMRVLATKIRLCENFTSEIFYWRKYPDLRYVNKCVAMMVQDEEELLSD